MNLQNLAWPAWQDSCRSLPVLLPLGGIEAHGRHMPLATDIIIADFITRTVSFQADCLVMPPLSLGCPEYPGRLGGTFPGSIALRPGTYLRVVEDLLNALYEQGCRHLVAVHASYANVAMVDQAAMECVQRHPDMRIVNAAWWNFVSEATRNQFAVEYDTPRARDHHAAMVETSILLHIDADLVDRSLLSSDATAGGALYAVHPFPMEFATSDGVVYDSSKASPEIGQVVLDEVVSGIVDMLGSTHESGR